MSNPDMGRRTPRPTTPRGSVYYVPPPPNIAFLVTGFEGFWPVGTAAIVYAPNREKCKRVLRDKLRERDLGKDDPDKWTIEPITPIPPEPQAIVVLDGNY